MADVEPFESETTDFPVLIGCSFFWKINLDPHSSFTYAVVVHSLPCNPQLYAHTHMRTHTNMAEVCGCQPVRVLDVM